MFSRRNYNQESPLWDFVNDFEEQTPSHPWFGRRGGPNRGANRAANWGEAAENNTNNPFSWTEGGAGVLFGGMPHRHRHGHGLGPGRRFGRRQQQAEAAVQNEQIHAVPETEKEPLSEKVTFEAVQSDGEELPKSSEKARNGPGARRGGPGGRGGRGQGLGRARRAAAAGRGLNQGPAHEGIQTDSEKTLSGDEAQRGPGPRRGGRGIGRGMGRGAGRGAGRGMGQGMGRGMGPGMGRGMGPGMMRGAGQARLARIRALNQALHAEMMGHGPAAGFQGRMPGAQRGMRGGRGLGPGRGRGAGRARQLALARGFDDSENFRVLQQRGPGARRGGPGGPGGRGRGLGAGRGRGQGLGRARSAPPAARGFNPEFFAAPAFRPGNGPAARRRNQSQGPAGRRNLGPVRRQNQGPGPRQNQGPNKGQGVGPNRRPNANRSLSPRKGPVGPQGGPRMQRFGPAAVKAQGPHAAPNARKNNKGPFRPEVDVFNHPHAFYVHASLPGAKKEDIEVNWNPRRSVLRIVGHVNRPGDEEFLKTLAMKERKVGAFRRRVPFPPNAQVDVDSILAKMEDGVLKIEVPKMKGGFVEVKKVNII